MSDKTTEKIFSPGELDDRESLLIHLYKKEGRTLDDLPYTLEFDELYKNFSAKFAEANPRDTLQQLFRLRKSGRLPRMGRASSQPFSLSPDEKDVIIQVLEDRGLSLSLRDRLPYTAEFDDVFSHITSRLDKTLSKHDVWRVLARLSK